MGDFDWDGTTYEGSHEPLVTREIWQRVQELLDARAEDKTRKVKHDFAFTGLVRCGHCGCMLVGEIKKGRYVYYHCTGNRGKCPEPYTRQEIFTGAFAGILQELVIPPRSTWTIRGSCGEYEVPTGTGRLAMASFQPKIGRVRARGAWGPSLSINSFLSIVSLAPSSDRRLKRYRPGSSTQKRPV